MLHEPPSLLITDDDFGFRDTLRGMLDAKGFRTLVAADGQEALEIVRSEPVHVMLLDMHMPRLSGLDTIRTLRRFPSALPCILMSAAADDAVFREALQWQPVSVLAKPVSGRRLLDVLATTLHDVYGWPSPPPLAE